jgi:hypothetical protein
MDSDRNTGRTTRMLGNAVKFLCDNPSKGISIYGASRCSASDLKTRVIGACISIGFDPTNRIQVTTPSTKLKGQESSLVIFEDHAAQ